MLVSWAIFHLLVDGYNVTKTGYGEQSLEVQRGRLLAGVGGERRLTDLRHLAQVLNRATRSSRTSRASAGGTSVLRATAPRRPRPYVTALLAPLASRRTQAVIRCFGASRE